MPCEISENYFTGHTRTVIIIMNFKNVGKPQGYYDVQCAKMLDLRLEIYRFVIYWVFGYCNLRFIYYGLGKLPDQSLDHIDTGCQLLDKRTRLLKDLPSHRDSMGIAHGRSDIFAARSQCVEFEKDTVRLSLFQ